MNFNINAPFDFLGIDTLRLFTAAENVEVYPDSFNPKAYKTEKGKPILSLSDSGLSVIRIQHTRYVAFYYFCFSLSRLYNGVNYSSYSPIDYGEITSRLDAILERNGLTVINWFDIKVSRIDLFRNLKLNRDYNSYVPILKTVSVSRTKIKSVEDSKYHQNNSFKMVFYNKAEQLRKVVKLEDSVLRIECRYTNPKKIKKELGSNYFFQITNSALEDYFHHYCEKAFSVLRQFEFKSETNDLQTELCRYFTTRKKRFPKRLSDEAFSYFEKYQSETFDSYLSELKLETEKKSESERKRKERKLKTAKELLNTAILVEQTIQNGGSLIDDLRSLLFNSPSKISSREKEPKKRKKIPA
ncbi:hypothetical protein L9Z41_17200 [Leptospira noguchii]|uniref:hypothetical protein n=1 Tax=Leptospira noguchii TaxID=28182 RepID=UPI001F066A7E|nr:hypothetical protein [Leptospira noguchii]MCH1917318.1 hypothetical protein [Leptospira noguchii]UOG62999.1 hypothetical protein MAL04_11335 [Leptospira noguchii]